MTMMLLMTNPGLRVPGRPSPGALAAMGTLYAIAWTLLLVFMFGPMGALVGWPATIAASAIIGGIMSATNASPGDMGVAMATILVLAGFVVIGMSIVIR